MKTKSKLEEKKLSKAELEAREKVMKDLKKNKSALVKRYGKDAEAVMYGRATNIAKKMAESENKNRIKELVRKALMQEADIEVDADRYEGEQKLAQAAMMLDALESLLKKHDWWYMMSDDNRAYTSGSAQQYEIRKIMKELEGIGYGEDAKTLFNQYAPDGPGGSSLKIKEGKKEDMDKDGDIDSKDYLLKRDAAIKKAKGEVKEASMFVTGGNINPELVKKVEQFVKGVAKYYDYSIDDAYLSIMTILKGGLNKMNEDIDLGHKDNEPHMIKGDLYQIGKYAMELYATLEEIEETGAEVDFPAWWQSKITVAKENMDGAKHYLEFELAEPAVDAFIDKATGEEPHMGEPEAPMMEAEISAEEKLAGKIMKALKDMANKDASDQHNLKQARIALNKGNLDVAKKIANPYLKEEMSDEDMMYKYISKYVSDPDDIDNEMENYRTSGYQSLSEPVKAGLRKDIDFMTYVQMQHDEDQFKKERGL
jgi:hypothetical protein